MRACAFGAACPCASVMSVFLSVARAYVLGLVVNHWLHAGQFRVFVFAAVSLLGGLKGVLCCGN